MCVPGPTLSYATILLYQDQIPIRQLGHRRANAFQSPEFPSGIHYYTD